MDTNDKARQRQAYIDERKNFLGLHSLVREDDPPVLERDYTQVSYKNSVYTSFFDEFVIDEFDAFRKYYTAVQLSNYHLHFTQEATLRGKPCSLYPQDKVPLYEYDQVSDCHEHYHVVTRKNRFIHESLNISLSFVNQKERCIRTSKAIAPGTVLIVERAIIMANSSLCKCNYPGEHALHRCFLCAAPKTHTTEMNKCKNCNMVLHCKNGCKLLSTEVDHSIDCPGLKYHFWGSNLEDRSYIAMRMMLYGAKSFFVTGKSYDLLSVENWGQNDYSYSEIFHLPSHFHQQSKESLAEILYLVTRTLYYIKENTTFFSWVRECVQEEDIHFTDYALTIFIGGLLLKHYCQSIHNNVVFHLPNYRFSMISEFIERKSRAICPFIALLNHSCQPNAVLIYQDDVAIVKSFKNIEEGEEITIAYKEIDIFEGHPFRNEMAVEILGFECECKLCTEQGLHGDRVYKCQYCEGPVELHFTDPVTKKRRLMSELLKDSKKKNIVINKDIEDYLNQSESGDTITIQLVVNDNNELKSPEKDAIRRKALNIDGEDKNLYDESVLEEFERMASEMDIKKTVRILNEEINKENVIQRLTILSSIKEEDEEKPVPSTSRDSMKQTIIDNSEAKNTPEDLEDKEEPISVTSRASVEKTEDETKEKTLIEENTYIIDKTELSKIPEDSQGSEELIPSTSRDSLAESENESDEETLTGEETEEESSTEERAHIIEKKEAEENLEDFEEPIPSTSRDSLAESENESDEETLTGEETEEEFSTEENAHIEKKEAEKNPEDLKEKEEPIGSSRGDSLQQTAPEKKAYIIAKEAEKIPKDFEETIPNTSRDSTEDKSEEDTLSGDETEEFLTEEITHIIDKRELKKTSKDSEENEELISSTSPYSIEETEDDSETETLTGDEIDEVSSTKKITYVINKRKIKKEETEESEDDSETETLTGDEIDEDSLTEEMPYVIYKRKTKKNPESLEEKEEPPPSRDSEDETEEETLTGDELEEDNSTEEIVINKREMKKISDDLDKKVEPLPSTSRGAIKNLAENEDQIAIPGQGKISLEEISNITKKLQDIESEEGKTIDKDIPGCSFTNNEVQNITPSENEDAGKELNKMENIITKLMLQPPGENLEFFTLQANEFGETDEVKTEPIKMDSDEDKGPVFTGECRTCKKFNDLDQKATVMYYVDELILFCDEKGYASQDTEDALDWCLECLHKDSAELYHAYYSKFTVYVAENNYVGMLETLHEMRSMSERRYGRLFYPVMVSNLLMIWNTVRLQKWIDKKSEDPVHEVAVLGKTKTYLSVTYHSAQMYVKENKLQHITMMQQLIDEKIQNLNLMMALKISSSQITIMEFTKKKKTARNLTDEINKLSITAPNSKKVKMLTSNEIEEPTPSTSGIGSSSSKSSKKKNKKSIGIESKDQEQVSSTSGKTAHQNIKHDENEEQSRKKKQTDAKSSEDEEPNPGSKSSNIKHRGSQKTIPPGRTDWNVNAGMKSALKKRKKRR